MLEINVTLRFTISTINLSMLLIATLLSEVETLSFTSSLFSPYRLSSTNIMSAEQSTQINGQFGLELFKHFFKKSSNSAENTSISPLSISAVIGLVLLGARETTAAEIRRMLHWESSNEQEDQELHKRIREYLTLLDSKNDSNQVVSATRMYIDKARGVLDEFKAAAGELYLAEPVEADFLKNPDPERIAINSWVAEQTQNKIENLLGKDDISSITRLVLINALYFKGQWQIKFNERLTRPGPFKVSPDVTKNVPIMRISDRFPFVQDRKLNCTAVALPYNGKDLDMVVVVPSSEWGLSDLVDKLDNATFSSLLADMDKYRVKIEFSLPKFKVTSSLNLNDALLSLGMRSAFSDGEADFRGVSPKKDLFISTVVHKVYVAVDEQGTEAAAATAVVANNCLSMPPPEINVDQPFLFAIRDKRAGGSLLFLGAVFDPEAS